jgi:hypothetical protein
LPLDVSRITLGLSPAAAENATVNKTRTTINERFMTPPDNSIGLMGWIVSINTKDHIRLNHIIQIFLVLKYK